MADKTNFIFGKEVRAVVTLSVIFLTVFTSYNSVQNLQSSINQVKGLGVLSLMCIYSTMMVSAVLSPLAIQKLTAKGVIILSCSVHLVYAGTNFYPRYWTILPASVLLGSISGMFWAAQATYVATCSFSYAERLSQDCSYVLGRFYSLFSAIFVGSGIIGNLLSSLLLGINLHTKDTNTTIENSSFVSNISVFFNNDSTIGENICLARFCPVNVQGGSKQPLLQNKPSLYYLLGAFACFIFLGLGITIIFLPQISRKRNEHRQRKSMCSIAVSSARLLGDRKLLFLCPSFLAMGWSQSFKWTDVTQAYVSCTYGVSFVGYLMATHGICFAISTPMLSIVAKLIGRARLLLLLYMLYVVLHIGYMVLPDDISLPVLFVILGIHGALEGPISAQLQATVALMFENRKEQAFGNLGFWRCLSNTVYFSIGNYVCVQDKLITLLILYFATIFFTIAAEMKYNDEQRIKTLNNENENGMEKDANL